MRRWILRTIAMFTFRRAWLVLPLLVAATVAACWPIKNIDFDTSLAPFLPASPQAQNVREIIDYRNLEPVLVVVRAREPGHAKELMALADALAPVLNHPRYVRAVVDKVDELTQNFYSSLSDLRLIALLTPEDWSALQRTMTGQISKARMEELRAQRISAFLPRAMAIDPSKDPLGALDAVRQRLATSRGPTRLDVTNGYFMTSDGSALAILVYPSYPPENARATLHTIAYLEESRAFLMDRNPAWAKMFDIEFLGSHATIARSLRRMGSDLLLILEVSIPLTLLLILLVFRKAEAILFILLPPALAATWTLGLATTETATRDLGNINWVTAAVLLVIIGIGLLYSVHLYHRFTLELYRNQNYYRALSQSYVETGRGVLASASVVGMLFLLLFVAALGQVHEWVNIPRVLRAASGFGQLGVICGAAILCNLAACLLTLPALAWIKHTMARGRVKPLALYHFQIERLSEPAIATPRATLAVLLLASVIFGYHARSLYVDPRLASILPFFAEGSDGETAAGGGHQIEPPGRPVIAVVPGRTLEEALVRNDRLYHNLQQAKDEFRILSFDSLRTILPSRRSQESSIRELEHLDLEPYRLAIENACKAAGFKPSVYDPFLAALRTLQKNAAQVEYLEFSSAESDAFISTVQRYVTHPANGRYFIATPIYPHEEGFDPPQLAGLGTALGAGVEGLTLIGDPIVELRLSQLVKYNLALMTLASFFVILGGLALHYRSVRRAWLTFVPVGAEMLWICGGMGLAGIGFHFFTMLAMPLLLCLAMDNALQLTQYYHDRAPCTVRSAMASVGRAAVLSCGLISILYGTLALTGFSGLLDFGGAILIGASAVLVGSLMLQPALLQLFGRDQPILSILAVEPENDSAGSADTKQEPDAK